MAKLESTLFNMIAVLTGIGIVVGGALGTVYKLTKAPIENAQKLRQEKAITEVVPEFDNSPVTEKYDITLNDGSIITVFPAKMGNKEVGAALQSNSPNGYGGTVTIMVGLKKDGSIYNYRVLSHAETPGLGSKMEQWFRQEKGDQNIIGKNPSTTKISVKKDGGDIDAITAATISSRAFLSAVQKAYDAYMGKTDGIISATANTQPKRKEQVHEQN
ncbi:RnfABCDGE type electron transport complex subunit G [Barnesiella propionica]|uniref:RnfABCDGE type electron transport complex subunit G n=1 Tax=Barnesiella propionica TaxID=2981781 RepID=UPI0011C94E83|nr:RnfABCDGE type electron transport complex subunit G [Barnesiella propionica]MCU6768125.1 RnfABCDGE type electron transport complex subunit G [Barnesiella propionica]